jgi:DNA-binding NtrC family response regulator
MSRAAGALAEPEPRPWAEDPILLVEDKEGLRDVLRKTLEAQGHPVEPCGDGREAIEKIAKGRFRMILTDLKLPRADGLQVLRAARRADSSVPVVVMTAFGSVPDAVAAIKEGAYDFLEKPVDSDHLLALIGRALEHRRLARENLFLKERFAEELEPPRIVGESRALGRALEDLEKVAPTDATVLLTGESGTGKELFARLLHHRSRRRSGPFFAINCAAIPETLLENELFGHEKGAYTGAGNTRRGKIEMADGGTLFLDEIGDLSPALQGKILRVLEERRFERVGGTETRSVDLRLVAATNRDLKTLTQQRVFRPDLFFRLSVFPVVIPPLRERTGDIPVLARHFVAHFAAEAKRRNPPSLAEEAMRMLETHSWPGNVRELENAMERAVILCEGDAILPAHLNLSSPALPEPGEGIAALVGMQGSLAEVAQRAAALAERERIRGALEETEGNKTRAAELLQVSYKTLLTKIRELGLGEAQEP